MTIQFTIIGLGQIGTSMGLSLARHTNQVKRVGYDRALEFQNKAKSLGAFDAVKFNIHDAVDGADVVVLCLPLDQIEETLKQIGPDLRDDVVVMDTAPVKAPVAEWFKTHIAAGRHYVGLIPALSPNYLDENLRGIEAARADLFEHGTIGIVAPIGTPEAALNLAANFAQLIGAQPLFLDLAEADGMMSAAHLLPQLAAAALLNATVGQAGWSETRRLAGRPYVLATTSISQDEMAALALAAISNRENTIRALEMLIGGLTGIQQSLKNNDANDLTWRLERATGDRLGWWQERQKADWGRAENNSSTPFQIPGVMDRMLGLFAPKKDKK